MVWYDRGQRKRQEPFSPGEFVPSVREGMASLAVWTTCPNCKKEFSAQDTYLGKKVKCPSCTAKVEVLSQREQKEKGRWLDEQQKRVELFV